MSSNLSANPCAQCGTDRTPKWVPFSPENKLEFRDHCYDYLDYCDNFYNCDVENVSLEECTKLSTKCMELVNTHAGLLEKNSGDRVLLLDQMHHICDKYDSLVKNRCSFNKDAAAIKCLYKIASHYKDMARCFANINCGREKNYLMAACGAYKGALIIESNLGLEDPLRYLEKSMELAATMRDNENIADAYDELDAAINCVKRLNADASGLKDDIEKAEKRLRQYEDEL